MFVMGNFFGALAQIVEIALTIYYWCILIRALISWVNPGPFNPIVEILQRVTEPVLEPIRRVLPPMPLDFSPLVAFFAIIFLKHFLVQSLYDLSLRIR